MSLNAVQKDYQKYAPVYETKWAHFLLPPREWIIEKLITCYDPNSVFSALDLGCGTGELMLKIQQRFPNARMTGIDTSPDMLKQAEQKVTDAIYYQFDLENSNWPIKNQKYDVILCQFMLHHLEHPAKFLLTLKEYLKTDGTLYLSDFATETMPMKLADIYWQFFKPSYGKAYTAKEMKELLREHGFTIKDYTVLQPEKFWQQQVYQLSVRRI